MKLDTRFDRRRMLAGAAALGTAVALRGHGGRAQSASWRPLAIDSNSPPARWDHHLAADAESGTLFLFGGRDGAGASFADTWVYDIAAGTWSQLDIEGPALRFGAATAEDRNKRRLYLFGGQDVSTFYNDTWRFDFKSMTWRLQDDGSSIAPTPRYGLGGALDGDGNVVISHGFTFEGRFDDTWTFDTRQKTWLDSSPAENRPLNRCLHEMARDPETGRILLFGGCSSGYGPCPQGDLWSFDPAIGTWTDITPAAGPSARSNPAMVWDESGGRALLFGGQTEAGKAGDLWQGRFDGETFVWTPIDAGADGPAPRSSHDAVMLDGRLFVFGGSGDAGVLNDLWVLEP
jgi:hypothetical protein